MKREVKLNKKIIVPPIKSQGIKTKLVPWIMDLVKQSNAEGHWVEPFLGTGVVAFNSGFKKAILSDSNPHLIEFYKRIQTGEINPEIVKEYLTREGKLLEAAPDCGYFHYRTIRDRFNEHFEPLDFLFLSRAGFNGMIRFSKKGKWNIPFCKKPTRFAQSYVTKIYNQTKNVQKVITNDWKFNVDHFRDTIKKAKEGDIIYCDPPYIGRYVDYYNGWNDNDELELFTLLKSTKAKFILSTWHHNQYRSNEMIEKYWGEFNIQTKDHFYHSGGKIENRRSIVEALVYNFEIDENVNATSDRKIKVYQA